jgi:serralysin
VWTTDSNGNYSGNLIGAVSGNSYALESLEPVFNQDLNGDGVTGLNPRVIHTDTNSFGSASLAQIANNYFLFASGGTTGPELQYNGAAVTSGEFGNWNPIGAVQTANGYEVAWKNTGTGQYTVWTTDSNGNYSGNLIGAVSGNSYALESLEPVFNQDLNGDGNVGLYAASGTILQISQSLSGASGAVTIGANATLELAAADSASVTFAASTGELKLDQPSTFSGEIFNFTGDGTLSGSNQIDLKGFNYNTVHDSYANGVLTVTDGRGDTAKLNFNGSYVLANFAFASDGNGGTIVYDPPVSSSSSQNSTGLGLGTTSAKIGNGATLEMPAGASASVTFTGSKGTLTLDSPASASQPLNLAQSVSGFAGQNLIDLPDIAFDNQAPLGYAVNANNTDGALRPSDDIHIANMALLGGYMASSFAFMADEHGATTVPAQAATSNDHALLSTPHH